MLYSETEYKRAQPLLGTFFSINISRGSLTQQALDEALNSAFAEARRLESIFSRFSESSLAQLNRAPLGTRVPVARELYYLLQLALDIWQSSSAAFNPFFPADIGLESTPYHFASDQQNSFHIEKLQAVTLDLSGIAKGYIVDRVVEALNKALPGASGVVNAGGDMKFFNTQKRCVNLRLGNYHSPIVRTIVSQANCIASSSLTVAQNAENSSSDYGGEVRKGLSADCTAVVMAHCCCIADSLTKLALYGSKENIEACSRKFDAKILIFRPNGSLEECYGEL